MTQEQVKYKSFSANKFSDRHDLPFDPIEYSRFKHGDKVIARKFGEDLANKFCKSKYFAEILKSQKQIVCLSAPYIFIKTASNTLMDYFVAQLNLNIKYFSEATGIPYKSAQTSKIHREKSYPQEYGLMSNEERKSIMENDEFHTDYEYLRDKVCLHIDDVIIGGHHRDRVIKMIESNETLANNPFTYFVFFAELTSGIDPTIEHFLNYAFVKNLMSIDTIIKSGHFTFNTRVTKYILASDPVDCHYFLNYQSLVFLKTLLHYTLGNNYHQIDRYETNLTELINTIDNKSW